MNNTRCGICNVVSSEEIETNAGEVFRGRFAPDPKNKLFYVCTECSSEIEEHRHYFWYDDWLKESREKLEERRRSGEVEFVLPVVEDKIIYVNFQKLREEDGEEYL